MPTSHLLAAEAPANRMVATIINTMPRGTSSVRPTMRLRSAGVAGAASEAPRASASFLPVISSIP